MDNAANETPFYSQATAAAMRAQLDQDADTIRQLRIIIGALEREAENQAATIQQLREDVEIWRTTYTRAVTTEAEKD